MNLDLFTAPRKHTIKNTKHFVMFTCISYSHFDLQHHLYLNHVPCSNLSKRVLVFQHLPVDSIKLKPWHVKIKSSIHLFSVLFFKLK